MEHQLFDSEETLSETKGRSCSNTTLCCWLLWHFQATRPQPRAELSAVQISGKSTSFTSYEKNSQSLGSSRTLSSLVYYNQQAFLEKYPIIYHGVQTGIHMLKRKLIHLQGVLKHTGYLNTIYTELSGSP